MSSFAIEKSQKLQEIYYSLVFLLKVEKQFQAYCTLVEISLPTMTLYDLIHLHGLLEITSMSFLDN